MDLKELVALVVAAAGGLGTSVAIAVLVFRHVVKDWSEWRDRVEGKIDRLQPEHILKIEGFDPERLKGHYQKVHELTTMATECKLGLEAVGREVQDHEQRIRHLEFDKT